jgi:hypothetical protein
VEESSKVVGATAGAVGLSTLALAFGACCVAPWAVTLLGVGGAVLLARLSFAQPYVIATSAILIAVGFWFAYRRQPVLAGESCPAANRNWLRWLVWIGATLVVIIDAWSLAAPFLR